MWYTGELINSSIYDDDDGLEWCTRGCYTNRIPRSIVPCAYGNNLNQERAPKSSHKVNEFLTFRLLHGLTGVVGIRFPEAS